MKAIIKWIGLFCITGMLYSSVSCAESSDINIENPSEEIIFTVAPVTKSSTIFENNNVFQTTAFYNREEESWNTDFIKSQKYIAEETVISDHGIWKSEHICSWPNDNGGLTFFSWSVNRDRLDIKGNYTLSVSNETGISLSDFDISLNSDMDFLVADISEDLHKKSSVITKFNQQLSKIKISAMTIDDYSSTKTITIDSVIIRNIAKIGSYQQCEVISNKLIEVKKWTISETYNLKINDLSQINQITGRVQKITDLSVIPQTFRSDEQIEIFYTIKDLYSGISEHIKERRHLKSIIGNEFKSGTAYLIEIKIGLDQILYDPCVGDWTIN